MSDSVSWKKPEGNRGVCWFRKGEMGGTGGPRAKLITGVQFWCNTPDDPQRSITI